MRVGSRHARPAGSFRRGRQLNMRVTTFASGSGGNCTLVSCGGKHILVDAGISMKRIRCSLSAQGLRPDDLSGIFVTHTHTDHIAGLRVLLRQHSLPVYTSPGAAARLLRSVPEAAPCLRTPEIGEAVQLFGLRVLSFPTAHDAPGSVGYVVESDSCRLGICTDLGCVTEDVRRALAGTDAVILEANHDPEMLRTGPRPEALKRRILSPLGHLSNELCAELAAELFRQGTRAFILGHLSVDNNRPELALDTVRQRLPGQPRLLVAAPPDAAQSLELEACTCWG